jgi:hypothetical protein
LNTVRTSRSNKANKLHDIQNAFLTGNGDYQEKDNNYMAPDMMSDKKSTIAHSQAASYLSQRLARGQKNRMNTFETDHDRVSQSVKSRASRQSVSQKGNRKTAANHFNSMRKLSHDQTMMMSKKDPFLNDGINERFNKLSTTSHVFNQ